MEAIRLVLLAIHLTAGIAALVLFWVPALTKKGSPPHRRAGRAYVIAMTAVAVTGFILAAFFFARGNWQTGTFLLFLGLITSTSLWNGWRVLKLKQQSQAYAGPAHVAVALLNVAAGTALIAFGIAVHMPLFYSFGPVGLVIGGGMLALRLRSTAEPKYWLYEHFTGMIGSGIASHVAFLAFGGRQLFGLGFGGYAFVLWLTPVVIGTAAITALNFHYRTRAATRAGVAPA